MTLDGTGRHEGWRICNPLVGGLYCRCRPPFLNLGSVCGQRPTRPACSALPFAKAPPTAPHRRNRILRALSPIPHIPLQHKYL